MDGFFRYQPNFSFDLVNNTQWLLDIFRQKGIPFATSGTNCGKGNCVIKCPFCGDEDKSMHMSIDLVTNKGYHCWRNSRHGGQKINRLLRALGITEVIDDNPITGLDDIISGKAFETPFYYETTTPVSVATLPSTFVPIMRTQTDQRYRNYLISRKFHSHDIDKIIDRYGLMRSVEADPKWVDRIITPFQCKDRWCWQGRTIYNNNPVRYLSPISTDVNIKATLYRFDEIINHPPSVLLVLEGSFDSITADFYKPAQNLAATCVFGVAKSDSQVQLLREISRHGVKILVLFDPDKSDEGVSFSLSVPGAKALAPEVLGETKDFGDLTPNQSIEVWKRILSEEFDGHYIIN